MSWPAIFWSPACDLLANGGQKLTLKPNARDFSDKIAKFSRSRGLDAAVLAVPSDAALAQAQSLVRGAGQMLLFAHTRRGVETKLDLSRVCVDEQDLLGSYSSDITLQDVVKKMVFTRKLDVRTLITHQFKLEQTNEAVALASNPTATSLKIVIFH